MLLALTLVLGRLALAAGPTPPAPAAPGYLPSGSAADLADLGRLARLRDPRVRLVVREAEVPPGDQAGAGETVIAELEGAGIIQRIACRTSAEVSEPTPSRIRITLDGADSPTIDVAPEDLFSGGNPRFPAPLSGTFPGGGVCHVPIAFRDGCKVVASGGGGRSYRVAILALPSATGVVPFSATATEEESRLLERARKRWEEPEVLVAPEGQHVETATFAVEGGARSMQRLLLPAGPRTIRAFDVQPTPETADAWRLARLRLVWDGDDPASAGVDLPVGLAFGVAEGGPPYRSLLTGQVPSGWYNRFPMPYRREALLQIDTERPIRGALRIRSTRGIDPDAGYFRARLVEGASVASAAWRAEGRGHYIGTFWEGARGARLDIFPRLAFDGGGAMPRGGDDLPMDFADVGGEETRPVTYPSLGIFGLRADAGAMRMVAYRWHPADPIPFARSIAAASDRPAGPGTAAAVFWYSERPGPQRPRN